MARPRIFLSSTYYDLKHIRSSLEAFIESVGYEPILSERGDIAYTSDAALDESCYREASTSDIFVLIIGGRYGAAASSFNTIRDSGLQESYDSITRKEFDSAYNADIPVFILIESSVHAEYYTYLRNKQNTNIEYAHVDSINVFLLIESVLSKTRNNPVYNFDRSSQIEFWLREQWAGLFRELLKNRNQSKQLLALTNQVSELKIISDTLKNYLEMVLQKTIPETSSKVIDKENRRVQEEKIIESLKNNNFFKHLVNSFKVSYQDAAQIIISPTSFADIGQAINNLNGYNDQEKANILGSLTRYLDSQSDFNIARRHLGLTSIDFPKLYQSRLSNPFGVAGRPKSRITTPPVN